jgi:hypothetical protein
MVRDRRATGGQLEIKKFRSFLSPYLSLQEGFLCLGTSVSELLPGANEEGDLGERPIYLQNRRGDILRIGGVVFSGMFPSQSQEGLQHTGHVSSAVPELNL